jgi:hypothetical protein
MRKTTVDLGDAVITKKKEGFVVEWHDHLERNSKCLPTLQQAQDYYYAQLAYDYLGFAIRDNSREEKIRLGKAVEEYGVDEGGEIAWPDEQLEVG